jgi:Domain of unknown function (DUF4397)
MKLTYRLTIIAAFGFMMNACEKIKEATELNPSASSTAQIVHAAPDAATPLPAYDIVVDGLVANGSRRITYGITSLSGGGGNAPAYLPLLEGSRNIKISRDSGKTSVIDVTLPFEKNKAYTIVAYDTLVGGKLKVVRLNDDLTRPASGVTHVRFVHAAPNAPAVDITLLRTAPSTDSVTLSNKSYLGANPNAEALSAFAPVPGGTYTLKVKLAGTQTLVTSASLGTTLTAGRIYTFYAIGTAQTRPLSVISTRHF